MMKGSPPIEVFCSYAHEDDVRVRKLIGHLSVLESAGLLLIWYDRLLLGGMDRVQVISDHLNRSKLILLFVSPDFMADANCSAEMRRALELHKANHAHVVPILVRAVGNLQMAPFAGLQTLPADKFLAEWSEREEDIPFASIAKDIHDIVKDLTTQAISHLGPNSSVLSNVPFPRKNFFTGREKLLKQLHTQLRSAQTVINQPQTLSGLGGIGKTQLAVEYAYRYSHEYQVILWAHAETTEMLTTSYTEIARLLQLPQKDAQKQEIVVQEVKDWLRHWKNWLLILDNVDEPEVLLQFLPPQMSGHLIVTTRAADLSYLGLSFGHALTVEPFTKKQALSFLLFRAGLKNVSSQEREYALLITNELDGLPLALNQVGAYLKATGRNLASYWKMYRQQRSILLNAQDDLAYPRSVAATLLLSFQRVEQRNAMAADLLRFCAFLASDAIPEELLIEDARKSRTELVSEDATQIQLDFDQACRVLHDYSLLTRDPQTQTLIVHRLVQAVLYDSMTTITRQQWMQRAVLAVTASFPTIDFEGWSTCERLLPHMITCATWIEQAPFATFGAANLLNKVGYYLSHRGRYEEAEPLFLRALVQAGASPLEKAKSLNNLAELSRLQGHFEEAEPLYLQALAIREQHLSPNHPTIAKSLNNLAGLYWLQQKYEQAEQLYLQALTIYEQSLGPDHPDTARSLNGLANLYQSLEKYAEAEPLYQRALRIWGEHLRPDHPYMAGGLNNLAENHRRQGEYEQAERLLLRAFTIHKQQLGVEHPDTARNINNLAQLYLQLGRHEQAIPLFRQALTLYKRFLVANHLDTAEALYGLAKLYHELKEYQQAEPLYLQALSIYTGRLGSEATLTRSVRASYQALLSECHQDKDHR